MAAKSLHIKLTEVFETFLCWKWIFHYNAELIAIQAEYREMLQVFEIIWLDVFKLLNNNYVN